jgi:hypothetical protein
VRGSPRSFAGHDRLARSEYFTAGPFVIEWQVVHGAGRDHTRQAGCPPDDVAVEALHGIRTGVLVLRHDQLHGEDPVGIEPERDPPQIPYGPDQEHRGNEQNGAHRDLARDKSLLPAGPAGRPAAGQSVRRGARAEIPPRHPQCRDESEQDGRQQRDAEREDNRLPIDRELSNAVQIRRDRRARARETPHGDRRAAGPEQRQEQAFGQQLADESQAAGAERRAQCHLAPSREAARQHQAGDIRADDQEDHADRARHDDEHGRELVGREVERVANRHATHGSPVSSAGCRSASRAAIALSWADPAPGSTPAFNRPNTCSVRRGPRPRR